MYNIKLLTFSKRHSSVTIPSLKRITIPNALAVDSFFLSIVALRASTLKTEKYDDTWKLTKLNKFEFKILKITIQ